MTSTTRHRTRYRCNACLKRFAWPHRYKRLPRCPSCGEKERIRNIEKERLNEARKQNKCFCNNYPFPHTSGTLRMCENHPEIHLEPSEEEKEKYRDCLNTPRSGFC